MANIQKELLLTQEYIKEIFDYRDGFLYWKISRTVAIKVGQLAGTENLGKDGIGRRKIGLYPFKKKLYASRIIYLWHHGRLPEFIDHKDRDPENNLIDNLRPATKAENCTNVKSAKNSSSKYLGVSWHKQSKRWTANGSLKGKRKYLGIYDTEIEAALAFNVHAKLHYGEFANLNIIDPHQPQSATFQDLALRR